MQFTPFGFSGCRAGIYLETVKACGISILRECHLDREGLQGKWIGDAVISRINRAIAKFVDAEIGIGGNGIIILVFDVIILQIITGLARNQTDRAGNGGA